MLPPSQILTFYIAHLLIQSTVKLCNCGAGQGKEGQEKASNERAGLVPMQFTVIQCSTWSRRAGRIQIDTNQRHDTGMLTAVEVCEQVGILSNRIRRLGEESVCCFPICSCRSDISSTGHQVTAAKIQVQVQALS